MDITKKSEHLREELIEKSERHRKFGRRSRRTNNFAMMFALLAAGGAVTYGFLPNAKSQVTAVLGLVPSGIAVLATSLKLESRSHWHYSRSFAMFALLRKIDIEFPDPPSQEQLTEVSMALGKLEMDYEAAWQTELLMNWEKLFKK